jgi:hypothetical protein
MTPPVSDVLLGFEVGTGADVRIPIRHLAITGQTQEAGKTTALEALIHRSGLRAVTFITKRGEGSFTAARRVRPYFRDAGDWQFVASILEASRGEKLKIERAWIIRASKGAHTLAEVHRNVKKAMDDPKIKGMSADMYLTLDAYLEVVVPTIGRIEWATGLDLADGVNVIDLSDVPDEMQHLVIQSSINWVLNREQHTVVVIPEAWKFIPQGRGTPVKRAAAAYIRQGAALKNFLWLDSQDLGGIDKEILRSVPVWILGVQRETNEIKRTLENIPDGIAKPKRADIATLELGQFIACWGRHTLTTYVQPAWLSAEDAQDVARGELDGSALARLFAPGPAHKEQARLVAKETTVTETEAKALRDENARLRNENGELARRISALEQKAAPIPVTVPGPGKIVHVPAPPAVVPTDVEAQYQYVKDRLIVEAATNPVLLRVLTERPEIEVRLERKVVQIDGKSLKGRLARLIAEGFFDEGQTQGATRTRLKQSGPDVNQGNLWRAMQDFVSDGFFMNIGNDYRAVSGMKVNIGEG